MTKKERQEIERFIAFVNRKLKRIERNIRFSDSLHAFVVARLEAKLARATKKRKAK